MSMPRYNAKACVTMFCYDALDAWDGAKGYHFFRSFQPQKLSIGTTLSIKA